MKDLYRSVFFASVLFALTFFFSSIPATTGHLTIDKRLLMHPDSWTLSIKPANQHAIGTEENCKQALLAYLRKHEFEQPAYFAFLAAACLTAAIFSLIGWRREAQLEDASPS